jgi:hypothetical protein
MWFMHDGAPPHFLGIVREHLNLTFAEQWIGRGGPVNRPARSPDLNPLDFDVELRLSPRWVGGNIGSTDATKTCHNLNDYIFETNNRKVINNTSLDSL